MALTRVDSYLIDLDAIGGITFDDQAGIPTLKVDAVTHRVGIGTIAPATALDVNGDVTITDKIIHASDTNTAIRFPVNDTVSVETAGSERLRVDSSGRLLVGTSTSVNTFGVAPKLQVAGGESYQSNIAYRADAFAPFISVGHSRSATIGTQTILQSGDDFGSFAFVGSDGTGFIQGAQISAAVDGTPGANDMPGRLVFSTTADGASSPTERMRINSSGQILAGALGSPTLPIISFLNNPNTGIFSPGANLVAISTGGTGRLFVDASGRLLVGTSASPSAGNGYASKFVVAGNTADVNTESGAMSISRTGIVFNSGDTIGSIAFTNPTGNAFAAISCDIDATPGVSDFPGRLTFRTTPDNSATLTERLRITSAGLVGIGTSAPSTLLQVAGSVRVGANDASNATLEIGAGATGNRNAFIDLVGDITYTDYGLRIIRGDTGLNANSTIHHRGTGNLILAAEEAAPIAFFTTYTERARIDSSGRLLVGTSTVLGGNNAVFQIASTTSAAGLQITRFNSNDGCIVDLSSNRNATIASYTTAQNGDQLARLRFIAYDGASQLVAAQITSDVDGTPGTNDMPGRLVFGTTADGASSPTERMRISSSGDVGIGTTNPGYRLDVQGGHARILSQGAASALEIGNGTTTNQFAFIDLVGDTTYTDYGLRLIRSNTGANTSSELTHRGTGALILRVFDAGTMQFVTSNAERMRIDSRGNVFFNAATPTSTIWASENAVFSTGYVGSNGGYGMDIVGNGYRNTAGGWTSLNQSGDIGRSIISLRPTANGGTIVFGADNLTTGTQPTIQMQVNGGGVSTYGASTKYTAATDSATAVTLTAASIIDGIRSGTPTASINYTLPTGTNIDAAFQDLAAGQSFEWSVINRASVTFNITLVANTTHTVFGNMVTGPDSSGRFLTRKTAANTFVTYRIG